MTDCKAYYCELGYYYNQFQKECVLDVCTNRENEKDIYTNDIANNETKVYNIEPHEELVFHLENDNYFYYIEGNTENIFSSFYDNQNLNNKTNLCMVGYKHDNIFDYEVKVNYFGTLKENATIKLTKIKKKSGIVIGDNTYAERLYASTYINQLNKTEIIYSLQGQVESIIYFARNNKDIKFHYLEYNFDVTPQEIINIDSKKFTEFSDEILTMKKRKVYIVICKIPPNIFSSSYLFMRPKNT